VAYNDLIERARRGLGAFATTLACVVAWSAGAHDIPTDVKINAFIKPDGHTLELLIRVPLAAMIEVDFPTRGPGYLDISRADDALHHAVKLYLIDNITLYEDGAALPPPRIAYARVSLASDRSFTSYEQARTHVRSRRWRTTWTCTGTSSCSTSCWNIKSAPTVPRSRSARASTGSVRASRPPYASCHPRA
jgi:hypothetical protein